MQRKILAAYDDSGIIVYQAFSPDTVIEAVRLQAFGKGFGLDRMTWIKPSLGWMLYRSGYASKDRQQRIAQVTITHDGFRTMLADAQPTGLTTSNARADPPLIQFHSLIQNEEIHQITSSRQCSDLVL